MIKLSVGAKPDIVSAHQGVLCQSSDYFKNAMKPEWVQGRKDPHTIDLSEDSPEDVILYVKWLYTGKIDVQITKGKYSEERVKEAESLYAVLVEAYIFGEKVLDTTFNKVILGKLIEVQTEYRRTPGPDVFCTLYSGTPAGCLAQRLLTQFVAHCCHFHGQSEWDTYFEGYPRELLVDVIKAMVQLRFTPSQYPWTRLGLGYLDEI
jgi:hypothetical protein